MGNHKDGAYINTQKAVLFRQVFFVSTSHGPRTFSQYKLKWQMFFAFPLPPFFARLHLAFVMTFAYCSDVFFLIVFPLYPVLRRQKNIYISSAGSLALQLIWILSSFAQDSSWWPLKIYFKQQLASLPVLGLYYK